MTDEKRTIEKVIEVLEFLRIKSAVGKASADNPNYQCCFLTIGQTDILIEALDLLRQQPEPGEFAKRTRQMLSVIFPLPHTKEKQVHDLCGEACNMLDRQRAELMTAKTKIEHLEKALADTPDHADMDAAIFENNALKKRIEDLLFKNFSYEGRIADLQKRIAELERKETIEPLLGLATTRQLLAEIKARIEVLGELDYRTVETDEERTKRKGVGVPCEEKE